MANSHRTRTLVLAAEHILQRPLDISLDLSVIMSDSVVSCM